MPTREHSQSTHKYIYYTNVEREPALVRHSDSTIYNNSNDWQTYSNNEQYCGSQTLAEKKAKLPCFLSFRITHIWYKCIMQFVTEHKWHISNGTYIFNACKTTDSCTTIIGIRFIRFKSQFISSPNNLFIDDAKLLKAIPFVWQQIVANGFKWFHFITSSHIKFNFPGSWFLHRFLFFVSYRPMLPQPTKSIIQAQHFALE